MQYPLVSVIIPGYNHAAYLRERIDSVLCQDYPNFEVIMIDDCSTDNSREIMLSYKKHKNVRHIISNEKNSGNTFLQWEKGIAMAEGEYVWIAESDDVADNDFLSTLMAGLIAAPSAVLAFSHSYMIGPEGEKLDYTWHKRIYYKAPGVYDGKTFCSSRMVFNNQIFNASMVVWKKQCAKGVSEGYKSLRHCGDWMFWFDVCLQGSVIEVPRKLNYFRQHPNKVSNKARSSGQDFEEMAVIQEYILDRIGADAYKRSVVRGRMTKRIRKSLLSDVCVATVEKHPRIFKGNMLDSALYCFDKFINLSGFKR